MKSVDPGILPQSHCSTFQPSEFARKNLIYMTWCGHYYCTGQYYMDRDSYPEALLLFVRNGEMDVKYNNKAYTIHKGDVLLLDCVIRTTTVLTTAQSSSTSILTAAILTRSSTM